MIKHILVPLDGSTLAEDAIPYAVEMVNVTHARVTLIHVIEKNPPENIHGQAHLHTREDAARYLSEIADKYFAPLTAVATHVHEEPVDKVADSITNHIVEYNSDLLIMCSHGNGGVRDMLYGTIAQQIIANKKIPVLVIHPSEDKKPDAPKFKRLMVPVDGNPEHEQGFDYAVQFARDSGASLQLFLVVPTYQVLQGEQAALGTLLPISTAYMLDELESASETYLYNHIDRLCKMNVDTNAEVRRGDPVDEIVNYAGENTFDMVIIGTHGKSGARAFWAGSKASRILSRLKTPVLLVPVLPK
jgi:nucleotide-binding universal stress UspA family protein